MALVATNVPGEYRLEAPRAGADLDIGEWYYGAGGPPGVALPQPNYIFECRAPFALVQLGAVGRGEWDQVWTASWLESRKATPGLIPLSALPDIIKSNLDFYDTYAK